MSTSADNTYTDKWHHNVKIASLTATLSDDSAPTASIAGPLADGTWHNETRPVSVTVNGHDDGAGVRTLELLDSDRTVLDTAAAPATSAVQPGSVNVSRSLSVVPASLGDGVHGLTVRVTDAAGERVEIPLTLRVDSQAPAAFGMAPDHNTTDTLPAVSFRVDGGPSGLASFDAWLDDTPMTVNGDTASFQPASDLSYGSHIVTWRAVDGAGNLRDGQWRFDVVDDAPPVISDQSPAAGWTGEQREPQIGFTLTDVGTGVDPSSLRVALDGVDVTAAGDFTNGRFTLTPRAPLSFASHTLRVLAGDRSGNAMPPATWSFAVTDVTPPVVSEQRPDPGSSGSDRTPVISFAVSDVDGSGIDPHSLAVSLDGVDVSADGQLADGRFTLTPVAPLAYGQHTVTARVSDLAGNTSDVRTWSFAVRDETPPTVSGRQPSPGVTVPGAATIGFDVADTGAGVDAGSLHVLVDGVDVMSWGTYSNGHFSYSPGNLGAGAHSVSVTVADKAGNTAAPITWEFAVANPATLHLGFRSGPSAITFGQRSTIVFAASSDGSPLAGARVLVSTRQAGQASFGPARVLTASASGLVSWSVAPARTTTYKAVLADEPSLSATRTVAVRQRVTLSAAGRVRHGSALRLSGKVQPARPGARVSIQLLTRNGWVSVARPALSAGSGYHATVIPPVAGRYVFRVSIAGTSRNAAGASRSAAVMVR